MNDPVAAFTHEARAHEWHERLERPGENALPNEAVRRLGRRVKEHAKPRRPDEERDLRQAVTDYQTELDDLQRQQKNPHRQAQLHLRITVAKRFGTLTYKPTATTLAAMAIHTHGVEAALGDVLAAAYAVGHDSKGALFDGHLNNAMTVVRSGLLAALERHLHENPGVSGSHQLAMHATAKPGEKTYWRERQVAVAMGMLEAAELAHKQPGFTDRPGSVGWSHACHANHPSILEHARQSNAYRAAMRLLDGPQTVSALSTLERTKAGGWTGSPDGIASQPTISALFDRWRAQGSIEHERTARGRQATPTPALHGLLEAQRVAERATRPHLTSAMRAFIVGPTRTSDTPTKEDLKRARAQRRHTTNGSTP